MTVDDVLRTFDEAPKGGATVILNNEQVEVLVRAYEEQSRQLDQANREIQRLRAEVEKLLQESEEDFKSTERQLESATLQVEAFRNAARLLIDGAYVMAGDSAGDYRVPAVDVRRLRFVLEENANKRETVQPKRCDICKDEEHWGRCGERYGSGPEDGYASNS